MKAMIELDDLSVDGKGEALRSLVFRQENGGFGCYSTFDVNDGFEEIDPHKYPDIFKLIDPANAEDDNYKIEVTAYESKDIVVMYCWDGDGDLLIWIKGEPFVYENTDCKCTYDWWKIKIQPIADSRDRTGVQ